MTWETDAGDRMEQAVAAAETVARDGGLGQPGRPPNRRSPFFVGMSAAAGVAVTRRHPTAAALRLWLDEVAVRRLDST
jgi:hypothetical protein